MCGGFFFFFFIFKGKIQLTFNIFEIWVNTNQVKNFSKSINLTPKSNLIFKLLLILITFLNIITN